MPKLYLVTVRWIATPFTPEIVDAVLNAHGDWLRFQGYTWLSWTDSSPQSLSESVRLALKPEDSVMVMRVDPSQHAGWAPPWVWEWVRKKAQSS